MFRTGFHEAKKRVVPTRIQAHQSGVTGKFEHAFHAVRGQEAYDGRGP